MLLLLESAGLDGCRSQQSWWSFKTVLLDDDLEFAGRFERPQLFLESAVEVGILFPERAGRKRRPVVFYRIGDCQIQLAQSAYSDYPRVPTECDLDPLRDQAIHKRGILRKLLQVRLVDTHGKHQPQICAAGNDTDDRPVGDEIGDPRWRVGKLAFERDNGAGIECHRIGE